MHLILNKSLFHNNIDIEFQRNYEKLLQQDSDRHQRVRQCTPHIRHPGRGPEQLRGALPPLAAPHLPLHSLPSVQVVSCPGSIPSNLPQDLHVRLHLPGGERGN